MNKIAIVGSEGYISKFLIENLSKDNDILRVDKIDSPDIVFLDLAHPENFDYNLLHNIDFVIFTAAISGPDMCANEYDFCWNINVEGTSYFIKKAIEKQCKVLFFSSDAVFGEGVNNIFDENSITAASTPYGKMKKEIEDRFRHEKGFKAIRLSYVVSMKDKFVAYCMKCIQENEIAEIFHPFYRNCITITDVVKVVKFLSTKWDDYEHTFLNIAGIELVSRIRIADEISRKFNEFQYRIVTPNKDFFKNRPAITQMQSNYLYKMAIIEETSFTDKIKRELEEVKL